MEDEGGSTPRPTKRVAQLGHELPNPLRFPADPHQSYAQAGPSNLSSRVPSVASSATGAAAAPRKPLTRRQQLLQRARAHENAGSPLSGIGSEALKAKDPRIKEVSTLSSCCGLLAWLIPSHIQQDILRLIENYLGEEGYLATKLVLHDEANLKAKERGDRATKGVHLKRAIMGSSSSSSLRRLLARSLILRNRGRLGGGRSNRQQGTAGTDSERSALRSLQTA